jgi:hypothetical protein
LPLAVAAVVAAGWLNQGRSLAETEAIAAEIAADGGGHAADRARYPLLFLYRRSQDEELYFADARAIRGLPYDRARLVDRGETHLSRAPAADGRWHRPYAEVSLEYPSAMLPFMLLPSFVAADFTAFARVFGALMAACLVGAAWLAIHAGPGLDAREARAKGWTFVALLLAQGGLAVQRLDAVPALFLAWALWAVAGRRPAQAGVAMGLATATKLVPVLLVAPLVAADGGWWRGRRTWTRALLGLAVAGGIAFAPMVFPPDGLVEVLAYHAGRGLHVESTWGALLGAWRLAAGNAAPTSLSFGSYNFGDAGAAALFARLAMPATLAGIALLSVVLARSAGKGAGADREEGGRRDRAALALLAGLAVLWLTAKVFSPQYLTWAMPLVLAVSGARGRALAWLLGAAMLVSQIYLRGYYDYVYELRPLGVVTLLVRLGVLVAFAAVALRGVTRGSPIAREALA